MRKRNKPELLLPAGNREAFYAALEAGADAVYLGLNSFNARRRASNFSESNLSAVLHEAHLRDVKVYITLNTAIKNEELPALLQLLHFLERRPVDAIIIQDWGVYLLVKRYFPSLKIHASTQMAIHNSLGVAFCENMGFERAILSRELIMKELEKIVSGAAIGIEIFVHGALCYSFSGLCLFSSFIGGNSANRGLCGQPCRRLYRKEDEQRAFFSLKDNRQIEQIRKISEIGVAALKVEGRLKPADYVYKVGTAYRQAIDETKPLADILEDLKVDFGREKTGYFLSGDVSQAVAKYSGTGYYVGNVLDSDETGFHIRPFILLQRRSRIFVVDESESQTALKIEKIERRQDVFWIESSFKVKKGSPVFLISENIMHFPNRFPNVEDLPVSKMPKEKADKIIKSLIPWQEKKKGEEYYARIGDPEWLKNLYLEDYTGVFLNFDKTNLSIFSIKVPVLKQNIERFWLELPTFIGEKDLDFYASSCRAFFKMGVKRFLLSHISQLLLLPEGAQFAVNENNYVFNDAAAAFFYRQRVQFWIYPLENEFKNLLTGHDRNGIVNMYFRPNLFFSRMPVKIDDGALFSDEYGKIYRKTVRDGMTCVIPDEPVVLFSQKRKLYFSGFSRFMIDLMHETPDRQLAKSLLSKLKSSDTAPSDMFNFLKELK
ncbi:MAG: U32 family peptidase [Bacteroidales bacterium]|jgi:putative protease|nr:U32 family peptidase [Bacteroidales bacterium]